MEYKIALPRSNRSSSVDSSASSDFGMESPSSRYGRVNDHYFVDSPLSSTTFHAVPSSRVSPRPSRLAKHLSVSTVYTNPQVDPLEVEDGRGVRDPVRKSKKPRRLFRNSRLLWYRVERCRPERSRMIISRLGMLLAGILLFTTITLVTLSAVIQLTYSTEECDRFYSSEGGKEGKQGKQGTGAKGRQLQPENENMNTNTTMVQPLQVEGWHSWKRSLSSLESKVMKARGWNITTWPDSVRLNHFRVLGTHNSYHLATSLPVGPLLYSHEPLYDQLGSYQRGVRQIELDVHLIGTKYVVYHLQIVDDHTTCYCLLECLGHVRRWSDNNPYHYPISVFFEVKAKLWEDVGTGFSGVTDEHINALNLHIKEAFSMDRLIVPSSVLGNYNSFKTALMSADAGWPPLKKSLGKIMFVWLDDVYDLASTVESIIEDPSLRKQLFFVGSSDIRLPYVTVAVINDPRKSDFSRNMRNARESGLLIRSLSDNPNNMRPDPERFNLILKASPTYLTSDFECTENFMDGAKDDDDGDMYCEYLPSKKPFECNPATAPPECFAIAFYPN